MKLCCNLTVSAKIYHQMRLDGVCLVQYLYLKVRFNYFGFCCIHQRFMLEIALCFYTFELVIAS